MKSPEAALRQILIETPSTAEILCTRIFPVIAPATVTLPFAVYRRSSIRREATFTGPLGNPTVTIELLIADESYESVRGTADAIRVALDGWTGMVGDLIIRQTFLQNESDSFAQLQGSEMPAVYTVSQSYNVIWEEITHG